MSAVTFDTHAFIRSLESAGMPTQQAEAISSAMRQAQAGADVATKGDLRETELRLGSELKLHRWMLGFMFAGVLALVMKSFF